MENSTTQSWYSKKLYFSFEFRNNETPKFWSPQNGMLFDIEIKIWSQSSYHNEQ